MTELDKSQWKITDDMRRVLRRMYMQNETNHLDIPEALASATKARVKLPEQRQ